MPKERITLTKFAANLIACVVFLSLFAFLLLPAIRLASAANGATFPDDLQECRRVDTGLGVSIVRPQNWSVHENTLMQRHADPVQYSFFYMRPNQCQTRREGSTISVRRHSEKPDLDASVFKPRSFRDRPAWEGYFIDSHNNLDYIATTQIHIDDGDFWYTIAFSTTSTMTELPPSVRQYLDSARFDRDAKNGG